MQNKKILLVGDANHQFITNYAKWLNVGQSSQIIEIDILSVTTILNENLKFFSKVYQIKRNFFTQIKWFGKYYRLYKFKKLIPSLTKYDFVHFHYFGRESQYICDLITSTTRAKTIVSIWGSDMYKEKSSHFIVGCEKADIITFANQGAIDHFIFKYKWTKSNIVLCPFGLAPLECLKILDKTKSQCKLDLGLNSDKLAITIGYNMSSNQQHIEILNQFKDENIVKLKGKIQLMLPITYGGSVRYKTRLLKKLNSLPFEYKIFDSYLSDVSVAKIRKASDIMLQCQITDQLSGSMLEHLFSKNVLITGSWLPYKSLKDIKCWFYSVDEIAEIKTLIPQVVLNYEKLLKKTSGNPDIVASHFSWDRTITEWIKLYKK